MVPLSHLVEELEENGDNCESNVTDDDKMQLSAGSAMLNYW